MPETYYLDDGATTKSMDKVTVSPGNDLKIECEVASPGSVLRLEFIHIVIQELRLTNV